MQIRCSNILHNKLKHFKTYITFDLNLNIIYQKNVLNIYIFFHLKKFKIYWDISPNKIIYNYIL